MAMAIRAERDRDAGADDGADHGADDADEQSLAWRSRCAAPTALEPSRRSSAIDAGAPGDDGGEGVGGDDRADVDRDHDEHDRDDRAA